MLAITYAIQLKCITNTDDQLYNKRGELKMIKSKRYTGVWINKLANNDISYYVQIRDEHKKSKRIKVGKKSEGITEAYSHNKRNELINKLRFGEDDPLLKNNKGITFDEVALKYFDDMKLRGRKDYNIKDTIKKYENHIKGYIGNTLIQSLNADILNKIKLDKVNEEYAPKTVNNFLILISTIINFANKNMDLKVKNYIADGIVSKYTYDNKRERFLSKGEVDILLEHTKLYKNTHMATLLGLSLGCRLGSILAIQRKHINIDKRTVTITDFKTGGETYTGYLHTKYFPDFEFLKDMKPNDYLVSQKATGNKVSKNTVQYQFRVVTNKLFNQDLDKDDRKNRVVFHTLRHTFCSLLAINNTPIMTIQKLAHHKEISSTLRYSKLSQESMFEEVHKAFI